MNTPPRLILLASALLLGIGTVAAAEPDRRARTVILSPTEVKNLRIETAEADEVPFEETIFALGRIEVLPGRRAVVSSRIAGRALRVTALPDHEVKAGDPLVVVESRQPGDPPPEVILTAPIDGLVTDLAVAPGDPVSPDKPLLAIVDLSTVYALAAVPEHLADQIRPGLSARITSPGWPGEVWESRLEHVGALADPVAGTIEAAFYVGNEGLWLRPGMRAEFHLVTRSRPDVLAVPREAVQGEGGNRFVFIADIELENAFVKSPVVVGAVNDRYIEIVEGVFPGDPVVTRGSYPLAFAGAGSISLKEALDAAHGHEHNADGSEKGSEADGSAAPDSHEHGGPGDHRHGPAGWPPLALASVAGNVVLLALLVLATRRRPVADAPIPPTGGPDAQ